MQSSAISSRAEKVSTERAIKLNTEPQASTTRHFSSEKANKNNYSRSADFPFSFYDAVQKVNTKHDAAPKGRTKYNRVIRRRKILKSIGSLIRQRKKYFDYRLWERPRFLPQKSTRKWWRLLRNTLHPLSLCLSPSLSVSQITRAWSDVRLTDTRTLSCIYRHKICIIQQTPSW